MKKNDIRKLYTQKVTELLSQGYEIHYESMRGSQGELAHIDLCRGSEILRVLLESGNRDYVHDYGGIITLTVGRWTEPYRGASDIIWNNRLEPVFQIEFAQISEDFYTSREEGQRMAKLRYSRWVRRHTAEPREVSEASKSVALRWVRKQPGMKSCKLDDIESIRRTQKGGKVCFEIRARGKQLFLHA